MNMAANCLRLLQVFVAMCIAVTVTAAQTPDALLTCPLTWRETPMKEKLRCDIAANRFNDQVCRYGFGGGSVTFKFQGRGSASSASAATVCALQNVTTNCPSVVTRDNAVCQCLGRENGKIVLELTIQGNSSEMAGGSWLCVPQCTESQSDITHNPLTYNATEGCKGVKFGEPAATNNSSTTVISKVSCSCPTLKAPLPILVILLAAAARYSGSLQQLWS